MNEKECIILLKGVDRTADINHIRNLGTSYKVTFHNSDEVYGYSFNEVNAEVIISYCDNCDSMLVMAEGRVVNATKVYKSQNYVKIVDGEERSLFGPQQVKLIPCKRKINNVKSKMIYLDYCPVGAVEALYDFGDSYRIVYTDGTKSLCGATRIHIDEKCPPTTVMTYLWQIAGYHDDGKYNSAASFLRRQYERLTYINSDSVLNSYLKNVPPVQIKGVQELFFPFSVNISQKQAVEKAFQNSMSIIEGPPGTGKTKTILNIIANAVMQNKTIAVVSDNYGTLKHIQEKLHDENYHFLSALMGSKENRDAFFYNQPNYPADMPEWQRSEADQKNLKKEINQLKNDVLRSMKLQNRKALLQQELADVLTEKDYYDTYLEAYDFEKIEALSFNRLSCESIISFLADNAILLSRGKIGFLSKLKFFFHYGFYHFSALAEKNTEIVLQLQKLYYDTRIELLEIKIQKLEELLLSKNYNMKAEELYQKSKTLFEAKLYDRFKEALADRRQFDKDTYDKEFASFIEEYPVIFSTTSALRSSIALDYLFDYIIIDDASQVDLASAALALSCCRNAVLAGDRKQLPHVVEPKLKAKIEELFQRYSFSAAFNYNEHSILSSMERLFSKSIAKTLLREHYRCHPQIIQYSNQRYYDGELLAVQKFEAADPPLILFGIIAGNQMKVAAKGDRDSNKIRELAVIAEGLTVNGRLPQDKLELIGFETPFRKLEEKEDGTAAAPDESGAAYRYLGSEKEIMIFSSVLDRVKQKNDEWRFVDDPFLVNAAVSRAMRQLVLITNDRFQKKHGSNVGDLIRYAEYQAFDDDLLQHDVISVFDLLYSDYSDTLVKLKSRRTNTPRFRAELLMNGILEKVLKEERFQCFAHVHAIPLKALLRNWDKIAEEDLIYVSDPAAAVDFIIYSRYDKQPVLAIEVAGFLFHEKKTLRLKRDERLDRILSRYHIELLSITINEGGEEDKLRHKLEEILAEDQSPAFPEFNGN